MADEASTEVVEPKVDEYPANTILIFRGYRLVRDTLFEEWGNVEDITGRPMNFKSTPKRNRTFYLAVGGMYNANITGDTIRWKETKPHGYWQHQEERITWDAESRTARERYDSLKRTEKESGRNFIKEAVEPLRDAYHNMAGPQKAQLIADVVRYITG